MKKQTSQPKSHPAPLPPEATESEEDEILLALSQIEVVDGLLYAETIHGDNENGSALELTGMADAAWRLTRASLETFERLDVVQLVVNARAEKMRRQA